MKKRGRPKTRWLENEREIERRRDIGYIYKEREGWNRWRQCKKERRERGDREVGKGKIEREEREGEKDGNRWIESERERGERRRYIKRDRGVIDGGHAKEIEKETEEIERETEERNRKGEIEKRKTERHTDIHRQR